MKVSKEQMAENRERILDAAAQLFREKGFDGIGVADLMKSAGLTHGGFYGHFASKDELMAQASGRALERLQSAWAAIAREATERGQDPLAAIETAYLSPRHRDAPGQGCLLAALGGDAARQGTAVRQAVTEGVRAQVEGLATLAPVRTKAARRQRALADYASLVGAMVLARAVDDEALSNEILHATAVSLRLPEPASR
ncbi:TetR/AcrR family transcriptional regulator [Acidovorax sp. D2M1]|uniref:TetR/AcrR family transcriptional regulator n=1 Tax=Acidovorax benzenivorans TaxID=2987520 RepID=A0ABT5RTW7_9BURK|nr:TetR/AcrR family transcriptional regulator [Acidovorax benzenivorans]MDD2176378.1 TetR/AcrR family transcriptional regulator [Acidovorax benzenivorans]